MAETKRAERRRRGRRVLEAGLVGLGGILTALLVAAVSWPPINDVTTGTTPEYPDLQPQVLRYSPELVFERAIQAIDELPRWQVVRRDAETGVVEAEARTVLFGFVDDITVRVEPFGSGSVVNVRSRSRAGRADFGQNARNIRAFQTRLEERLQLARQVR